MASTPGNFRPDDAHFRAQTGNVVEFPSAAKTMSASATDATWLYDTTIRRFRNPFAEGREKQRRIVRGEARAWPAVLVDALAVTVNGLAIFAFRFWSPVAESLWPWNEVERFDPASMQKYVGFLLLYTVLTVLFCNMQNLYARRSSSALDDSVTISKAVLEASLVLTSFIYLAHVSIISRLVVGCTAVLNIAAMTGWRYFQRKLASNSLLKGKGLRNVVIIGTDATAQTLAKHLDSNPQFGYLVKGFVDSDSLGFERERSLGGIDDLQRVVRAQFIDDVFITMPSERELVKRVALMARKMKINVQVLPELYDGIAWNAPVQYVGWFPMRVLHWQPIPASALLMKRVIDVIASAIGLLFLSPLLALIALIIAVDSPGPVLYRSCRIGKKGRTFTCYKFRTMVENAEVLQSTLVQHNERKGVLFKIARDPRVTIVGRYLRRFSLDELPQLWNVLIGEMSLVGPRPPVPGEYKQYDLEHLRRLDVTPGLTGLWQVTARQDPSFESYISLDLEYVENWSPLLDLKLLLRTVPVVLRGTGQ